MEAEWLPEVRDGPVAKRFAVEHHDAATGAARRRGHERVAREPRRLRDRLLEREVRDATATVLRQRLGAAHAVAGQHHELDVGRSLVVLPSSAADVREPRSSVGQEHFRARQLHAAR